MNFDQYIRDPVGFIDDLIWYNELGQPFHLLDHQRELLRLAFAFDEDDRLPWDTIIYSCPKKSGKTTINAAVALWWAFCHEAPNEIPIVANDLEQAQGRVFKAVAGLLKHNHHLAASAEVQSSRILFSNGTEARAIASDYRGEAGGNHGLTSWDELWAYNTESATRLYEELTPVPTRQNSIRFITSYAGWEGESKLLWDLYRQGVDTDEHPEGQGERIHYDLPIYANRDARLFVYWDHEPRMPWQTEAYYASQRRSLRPNTFLRLHANQWTTAESIFITPEMWDGCVDHELGPLLPTKAVQLYVGADGSTKRDLAYVVAVYRDGNNIVLACFRGWKPTPGKPLDLEETIEAYLRDLHERYHVREILYDPYQLHRSATTLANAGLRMKEFPQSTPNVTLMGQTLFDALNGKALKLFPSDELRQQALSTVAVENPRGWRIAKEKASKKIDGITALSMACVAAVDAPVSSGVPPAGSVTERALGSTAKEDPNWAVNAPSPRSWGAGGHWTDEMN